MGPIDNFTNTAEFIVYALICSTIFLYAFNRNPYYCLYFFIIWLPLQTFVLSGMAASDFFSDRLITFLSALKEVALAMLLVVLLLKKRLAPKQLTFVDYLLIINVAIIFIYALLPDSVLGVPNSLEVKIFGLRSALITLVIFYVGRCIPFDARKNIKALRLLIGMSVLIVLFGFVEFLFVPRETLIAGLVPYNVLKGGQQEILQRTDLSYVVNFSGFAFKRMMSFFLSPLTLAYFLIVPFAAALVVLRQKVALGKESFLRNPALILALFSLAILLSNTRAVLVASLIMVLLAYAGRSFYKGGAALLLLALVLYLSPMRQVFIETINLEDPSAQAHLFAYTMGIERVLDYPFGIGLGQAGPTSYFIKGGGGVYGNENATVGESLYLTTSMERGVAGVAFFLIFVSSIAWMGNQLSKKSKDTHPKLIGKIIFIATIAFLIGSITTEHWLGFQTSAIYWWYAGVAARLYSLERWKRKAPHGRETAMQNNK